MKKEYLRKKFWQNISGLSLVLILLAVFFTFATIGFVNDVLTGGRLSTESLLAMILYSGLIACCYAYGGIRHYGFIFAGVVLQLGFHLFYEVQLAPADIDEALLSRLTIDGIGIMLLVALGYGLFMTFIGREGIGKVRLQTEMELAREMHDVLVPPIDLQTERLAIVARALPASETGGDLVDVVEGNAGLTCYIADISGHGVGAALFMGMFKSAMHSQLPDATSLENVLNSCNSSLYAIKKRTMFLTAAILHFSSGKPAEFAVAGHLPILHFRAQSGELVLLSQKQIPLAAQRNYRFVSEKVDFFPGDRFILLTDGITETANRSGSELGLEKVQQELLQCMHLPPAGQLNMLFRQAGRHGKQQDDRTAMIIDCK